MDTRLNNIAIVAAIGQNGVIGQNGKLPWRLPADMRRFMEMTSGHTVIMGSKTFKSIGKPLPGRLNIIVSRRAQHIPKCVVARSPETALLMAPSSRTIFVIGGAKIYKRLLPFCRIMHITFVHSRFEGDAYFPKINWNEWGQTDRKDFKADEKNPHDYSFVTYVRKTR